MQENERLRRAMTAAHLDVLEVSEATGVDPKTVQRWLKGRVPHARHRWTIAKLVNEDERYLWAGVDGQRLPGSPTTAEVIAAYPHRAEVPPERWWDLLVDAKRQVDLLAYAMLFLPETHSRLFDLLRGKAAAGGTVRIAMVDPAARELAERDAEEGLDGGLVHRVRTSLHYFAEGLADCEGIELRAYAAPLYNSLFRFDDDMFVTPHLYATAGSRAPLLHLRRLGNDGIFDTFAGHFEAIWTSAKPAEAVA
jgi:transcriptional regulator with XRE-family HTH domain